MVKRALLLEERFVDGMRQDCRERVWWNLSRG